MKQNFLNIFKGGLFPARNENKVTHIPNQVSFIHTDENGVKTVRVVKGQLINDFIIDYTKPLGEIKEELDQLLDYWLMTYSEEVIRQIGRFPKSEEVSIYEGGSHIDIILVGQGSLGWLTIEDHYATKLKND